MDLIGKFTVPSQISSCKRESTNQRNRREVLFDFHIRYRGENIAKGLPRFSKTWRSTQNLKHLCYDIPSFTFNEKLRQTKLEAVVDMQA